MSLLDLWRTLLSEQKIVVVRNRDPLVIFSGFAADIPEPLFSMHVCYVLAENDSLYVSVEELKGENNAED